MVARAEGDRAPRGSAAMNMYILSPASWSSVRFQVQDEPRERERIEKNFTNMAAYGRQETADPLKGHDTYRKVRGRISRYHGITVSRYHGRVEHVVVCRSELFLRVANVLCAHAADAILTPFPGRM